MEVDWQEQQLQVDMELSEIMVLNMMQRTVRGLVVQEVLQPIRDEPDEITVLEDDDDMEVETEV